VLINQPPFPPLQGTITPCPSYKLQKIVQHLCRSISFSRRGCAGALENLDGSARRLWDSSCHELSVVGKHGGDDLVRWTVDFPWPMSDREYLFRRKLRRCPDDTCAYAVSRTATSAAPESDRPSVVRVRDWVQFSGVRARESGGVDLHLLYGNDMRGRSSEP